MGGDLLNNKEILNLLKVWGYYNPDIAVPHLKFLQKVIVNQKQNKYLY